MARMWSVKDALPNDVDLIKVVSFGAAESRVTNGTRAATELALRLMVRYPAARVAFGVYTNSPNPGLEERWKRRLFTAPIFAGLVESSVEEAENVRDAVLRVFLPKRIVVVTEEWHSPSAKLITEWAWKDIENRPKIGIATVPAASAIDWWSPMRLARRHYTWAGANLARHGVVCCP